MIALLFASLYTNVPHIWVKPDQTHCRYMVYPARGVAELLPNCIVPPGGKECRRRLRVH